MTKHLLIIILLIVIGFSNLVVYQNRVILQQKQVIEDMIKNPDCLMPPTNLKTKVK